ncbi:hypothetical protein HS088_TW16G00661 [Tripterygium wilfordii]|uniref:Intracellular protein transport protein USO1-like n=1 Tax=Tripterygium wilfordii TaxID=458696 RepID=A0A7J7CJN8_TRIWF|nr:uncharacterized protein At5g41620-like [Tripterygium wilfordii]KAF5734216.1 hypothetical protein HS088_TW16G00661 [Tripterygium wilfordii]
MKREEKRGDGEAEKEESIGEKLGRVVLFKKAGPSTPVRPCLLPPKAHDSISASPPPPAVSARKLAAALWEFHYYLLPLSKMHRGVNGTSNGAPPADSRIRHRRHHHHDHHPHQQQHHRFRDKGFELSHFLPDPSPSSPDQPESASGLRRHIAASLMQHHQAIERSNRALQPVSPASYGSSMEVAPYNPAVTPTSSLDLQGRMGESRYNLKTSTELLKVLNRIWSLEEQHASHISLIKALKTEVDHSRARIKELLRDQQADRNEIDDLMKQIAEEKLVQKSKEQDKLYASLQSVRDELEDERKLRKRSESLHRKLARELTEMKSSMFDALKDRERERKARKLLEDLCDEFAKGIQDYEMEVHALKQKFDNDWDGRTDVDRLILHISESWLDARTQIQVDEAQHGFSEDNSIMEKLGVEIETFLRAKRMSNLKSADKNLRRERRNTLESVPRNETVSAPQDVGDEEDSAASDSNCFELNKTSHVDFKSHIDDAVDRQIDETVRSNQAMKTHAYRERIRGRNPSSMQVRFEEQMAHALSSNGNKKPQLVDMEHAKTSEGNPIEISISQKGDSFEAAEGGVHGRENKLEEMDVTNSNYVIDNLIRSHTSSSQGWHLHPEIDSGEASCSYPVRRNQASPVRPWMSKLTVPDLDISESSSIQPPGMKENTLRAKLLEARSKGRSRLKIFKGSS